MSSKKFNISPAPHIVRGKTINSIMIDVIIAIMPTVLVLGYFNTQGTIKVVLTSVISAVIGEGLWNKYVRKRKSISDLSSVVTGLILGVIMPVHAPIWIISIGSIFAIIVVKMFFGGLGQNFMNPSAAAKIFLVTTWGTVMSMPLGKESVDMASTVGHSNLALIIAITVGGIYLITRNIINFIIPVLLIGSSMITYLALGHGFVLPYTIIFVAFFMATDYATTPINKIGKMIFAIIAGILAALIILKGGNSEGPYFAVIILNLFTPMIEQLTMKKVAVGEVEFS